MLNLNTPLLLASASPRRKSLLQMLELDFIVESPFCEEKITHSLPHVIVEDLALQKNKALQNQFQNHLILSADTLVFLENQILGKPKTPQEAFHMLRSLSGKTHAVYTGICLHKQNKTICAHEATQVTFASLNDAEIWKYIETGSPMDKAGAYGIQDDYGALFVEKINGDFFNVVGLPLHRLYQTLKTEFPEVLS